MSRQRAEFVIASDSLVALVGPSGAGKSTFARRTFPPEAVLSSDAFRRLVSGDESDQRATEPAFRLLHAAAGERLERGLLTVVDATNVLFTSRAPLLELAELHARPAVAIVFDLPLATCLEWNGRRPGRAIPARAVRRQHRLFLRATPHLEREGWDVIRLDGPDAVSAAVVRADGATPR